MRFIRTILAISLMWIPHPGPQRNALARTEHEILYGGARGGGKTDAGIAWMTRPVGHFPKYRGLVIRRNAADLQDWLDRANWMYQSLLAIRTGNPPEFRFPGGEIIRTGHLKDSEAYTKYMGHEYQRLLIEELTQIPREEDYLKLLMSCRSTIPGLRPQMFGTTNPGGAGHTWVKHRWVDPAPQNMPFPDPDSGRTRIYIPAKVDDNPTIMQSDPNYVRSLDALPEPLRSAWREGDWSAFAGQYFVPWYEQIHVIEPFGPFKDPAKWREGGWRCFVGVDVGYHHPFAAEYLAVDPDGNRFFYREIHGSQHTAWHWGEQMLEAPHPGEPIEIYLACRHAFVFNPLTFPKLETQMPSDKSAAEAWIGMGLPVVRANDDRIPGWHHLLSLMDWQGKVLPGGGIDFEGGKRPQVFVIRGACPVLQEQFGSAMSDEHKPDDVDKSKGNDDAIDAARYAANHAMEAIPVIEPIPHLRQEIEDLMRTDSPTGMYEWPE